MSPPARALAHPITPALAVAAVTAVAFLPGLAGELVDFDDIYNFVLNQHFSGPRMVAAAPALWLAGFGALTWQQTPIWRDSVSRGHHATVFAPDCARCLHGLGLASTVAAPSPTRWSRCSARWRCVRTSSTCSRTWDWRGGRWDGQLAALRLLDPARADRVQRR